MARRRSRSPPGGGTGRLAHPPAARPATGTGLHPDRPALVIHPGQQRLELGSTPSSSPRPGTAATSRRPRAAGVASTCPALNRQRRSSCPTTMAVTDRPHGASRPGQNRSGHLITRPTASPCPATGSAEGRSRHAPPESAVRGGGPSPRSSPPQLGSGRRHLRGLSLVGVLPL